MLQQYLLVLMSMPLPHILLLIYHVFSLRPSCFLHVPWRHTLNLHCTCAHYVYTIVKIVDDGLYFYFLFSLYFIFILFFSYFLFLEQLGLGFISHAVTSVTSWWHSHKTDHKTWENEVEDSGIKWCHTTWTTHVGLMLYTWSFRVGCTVVSMDHE